MAGNAKKRWSFAWLNAAQFLGAFNDNIFKLLTVFFIVGSRGPEAATNVSAAATAIFVAPFIIFMPFAGKLADHFSKRDVIVAAKAAEVVTMAAACIAFYLPIKFPIYGVLFLMAAQSAFFGPSKYGIVPELVEKEDLSRANSILEALTYLAIVLGTAAAPALSLQIDGFYEIGGLVCLGIAIAGLAASFPIEHTEPARGATDVSMVFFRDVFRTLGTIRRRKDLLVAVFGSAYFLLLAGFIHIIVIPYGMKELLLSKEHSGYLFLATAIGIGIGALAAGKISGKHIEFGIIPLGAFGLSICSFGMGLADGSLATICILLLMMGVSAGLFIVPIQAFIQLRSPIKRRGRILAASGFLGWCGVLISALLVGLFTQVLSMTAAQVFIILGVMTLILTIITIKLLPEFFVRFLVMALAKVLYRTRVGGTENVPEEGGVLLVSNHASWADAVLIATSHHRRIRFIMDKHFYNLPWLKPLCKLMEAIPISAHDPPKEILRSLKHARQAMDEGFMVCIFAEGAMTRTGMLRGFRAGFERIMKGSDYRIVPVYLGGAWGSIFSYYGGKPLSALPRRFPLPVSVHFGEPMSPDSSADQIRQKVAELSCDYFDEIKHLRRPLAEHFVRQARRNWRKRCMADSDGNRLNYGRALVSAIALTDQLRELTKSQEKVGIMLPPSIGASLSNIAVSMLGKVAVNLNYSSSAESRNAAIERCGIRTVISARRFTEKLPELHELEGLAFLEDILAKIQYRDMLKAFLKACLVPKRILAHGIGFTGDELAAVIFSSGSTGKPKGVMLSHHNILSNIEPLQMVFNLKKNDNLCAVLPPFHSFGYTCAMWLPLVIGVSATYCPNPLDGATVGKAVRENKSTILFAAPTFLLNYLRRAEKEDFASLREVVVGAEKLKDRIADAFRDKFGIRPLEGYGATECSPVISLNLPNVESDGVYQVGNKPGSVGHPIPGMAVRILDVETGRQLATEEEGLITVKGPSVMRGYLGDEEETRRAITDGWYNTGDVGCIDEDGFLTLTDRLSRFSKIAGEMVPHVAVEDVLLKAINADEQVVAVTCVPDAKRGEELVVLYTEKAGDPARLQDIIAGSRIPNIWKPKRENYIKIDSMPTLGSGKLDVAHLKNIALHAKETLSER